jgi:PDZ domain-containing protein
MNELTNKAWPIVRLLLIPYLCLLFLLVYPIQYYMDAPGGLAEVENLIEIDYNQEKVAQGSISTTYIIVVNRPSFFQFIVGYFSPYTTIAALTGSYADYTNEERSQISYWDKYTSVDASLIVAFLAAQIDNPDITISYVEKVLVYSKASYLSNYQSIAFGDEFIKVEGDNGTVTVVSEIANNTLLSNAYDFTFKNSNNEMYTVTLTKDATTNKFGITFRASYFVDKELTFPSYRVVNSNIGGPSGGLLQTLAIYNMLVKEDITQGLKIAGTGTIGYDGSVGYIGGVKQKIATAYMNKVDVFFIPSLDSNYYYDNYVEAIRACEELGINPDGWVIPIATFADALDYLQGLGE